MIVNSLFYSAWRMKEIHGNRLKVKHLRVRGFTENVLGRSTNSFKSRVHCMQNFEILKTCGPLKFPEMPIKTGKFPC